MAVDPNGKEIYIVTGKTGQDNSPELKKTTLLSVLSVLSNTTDGKALLDQYLGSSTDHLYITIGEISSEGPGHTLGNTSTFSDKQIPMLLDDKNRVDNPPDRDSPEQTAFNGIAVDPKASTTSFVTLNADNFGGEEQGFVFKGGGYQLGAVTAGHEIGAHAGFGKGHEAWGQTFENVPAAKGTPAASLNWQLGRTTSANAKPNFSLLPIGEEGSGVYKLEALPSEPATPDER